MYVEYMLNTKKALPYSKAFFIDILNDYREIPIKLIKPRDIKPTIIKVIPRPLRGAGTLEYFKRSLIAASATMASNQPIPEPILNATDSGKV
jgi:hypothetical protein